MSRGNYPGQNTRQNKRQNERQFLCIICNSMGSMEVPILVYIETLFILDHLRLDHLFWANPAAQSFGL